MPTDTSLAPTRLQKSLRSDLLTPFAIAFRARLRNTVIWSSSASLLVIYFITSRLRVRDGGGPASGPLELLDLALILGWATASLGDRPSLPGVSRASLRRPDRLLSGSALNLALLRVGISIADALVVLVGVVAISTVCGFQPSLAREWVVLLGGTVLIGSATSIQLEIIWMFSNRAIALFVAALLTIVALQLVHTAPSTPVAILGRLGFPVSALVSATEEPLRLDLAARALLAGVTYDLALVATLLALSGNRARG